jgi:hypothetical protein
MYYSLSYIQYFTTRKSDNTNGITDGNFPSAIFTDENNFISKSVGINQQKNTSGIADSEKFFLKIATAR